MAPHGKAADMAELCRAAHGVTNPAVTALCHQRTAGDPAGQSRRNSNTCCTSGVRAPFRFPDDLLALQRAWQQTYADLAQAPAEAGTTVLRRRLISLSGRLCNHPSRAVPAGWRAGGVGLRHAARTHPSPPTERQAA